MYRFGLQIAFYELKQSDLYWIVWFLFFYLFFVCSGFFSQQFKQFFFFAIWEHFEIPHWNLIKFVDLYEEYILLIVSQH